MNWIGAQCFVKGNWTQDKIHGSLTMHHSMGLNVDFVPLHGDDIINTFEVHVGFLVKASLWGYNKTFV